MFFLPCYTQPFSICRAQERLKKAREKSEVPDSQKSLRLQQMHRQTQTFSSFCSQIGHTRPISYCEFSPNNKMLATASWSGLCKLWSIPECEEIRTLRGRNTGFTSDLTVVWNLKLILWWCKFLLHIALFSIYVAAAFSYNF